MHNLNLFGRSNDSNKNKRQLQLTDEYWQLLGELADAKRLDRAAYIESYVDDLEKEKETLRALVTGMQEMAIQDQEYIRELTNELDQLEYDDDDITLEEQEQQFHDETTALQQQIQKLEIEKTALQQQVQRLNTETTVLPEKIQKLDLERTALQQKVQTLELENTTLSEKIQNLDLERTALQQKVQTLELDKTPLQQASPAEERKTQPSQVPAPIQTSQLEPAQTAPKQKNDTAAKTTGSLLQKSIGLVLSLAILFFVGGFTLPSTVHIERSLLIDARPADIFPLVGDLNQWRRWSPWAEQDPEMEMEISGSGEGQILQWQSDVPTVGNGTQEITEISPPTYLKSHLDFGEQGVADATFLLEAEDEGTQVSWIFDSDMREGVPLIKQPISTYFGFFIEDLIGTKYETGLSQIKTLAEQETPQPTHFLGWTPGERNFVKKGSALFRKRVPKDAETEEEDVQRNVTSNAGDSQ